MSRHYDTISFLSDYGHDDEFVGVVHSVLRSIAPHAAVVDITHGVRRHDIRAGGLALARAANYLNPGVVLAVVDPGVGTDRRAVAVEVGDGISVLVGPDNGLLAAAVGLVGGATRAVELTSREHRLPSVGGNTFDGRDVFGPAAAHLAAGVPIDQLGPEIDPAGLMPGVLPIAHLENGVMSCEVLWVDHFGNCQLNVDPLEVHEFGGEMILEIDGEPHVAMRVDGYDQIPTGRAGLIVDSSGLLSVAVARRSAAEDLSLGEGIEVKLRLLGDDDRPAGVTTPVELGRRETPT